MFKYALLLTFFLNFLFSDTVFNGECVEHFNTRRGIIALKYSNGNKSWTYYNEAKLNTLVNNMGKFEYHKDNKTCHIKNRYDVLNIDEKDYNFLSALVGILIGFTIFFFSVLVTVKVGSSK